jgi:TPR repeat protein
MKHYSAFIHSFANDCVRGRAELGAKRPAILAPMRLAAAGMLRGVALIVLSLPGASMRAETIDATDPAQTAITSSAVHSFQQGESALKKGDYSTAYLWLTRAAKAGSEPAQLALGKMYERGEGVDRSSSGAMAIYLKLARQGHREAQLAASRLFIDGEQSQVKLKEVMTWLLAASDQASAEAKFLLGYIYRYGVTVQPDYSAAAGWFGRAAIDNYPAAESALGQMYMIGIGVEKDEQRAVALFKSAADRGEIEGSWGLANALLDGVGTTKNEALAMGWFRAIADAGYASGECGLSFGFANGRGVKKDAAEAVAWARRSAEHARSECQERLGMFLVEGKGIEKNLKEGVRWLRLAADQGLSDAMVDLGECYRNGNGAAQSFSGAIEWYRRAIALLNPYAMFNLAELYEAGQGVPTDLVKAHSWFQLAIMHGIDLAEDERREFSQRRDKVAAGLSKDQLKVAMEASQVENDKLLGLPVASAESKGETSSPKKVPPTSARKSHTNSSKASSRVPGNGLRRAATGSGIVVNSQGDVVTNEHVVHGCLGVRVGSEWAQVKTAKADKDLALIRISHSESHPATVRDEEPLRPGDAVIAIGFPLFGLLSEEQNVTTGTVSALAGPRGNRQWFQISAPVQPGNSGGPVADLSGNVIGVVVGTLSTAVLSRATGAIPQNLNFAINGRTLRSFLDGERVQYRTARSERKLEVADAVSLVRSATVLVECWK